jgi:hypothetical protein
VFQALDHLARPVIPPAGRGGLARAGATFINGKLAGQPDESQPRAA